MRTEFKIAALTHKSQFYSFLQRFWVGCLLFITFYLILNIALSILKITSESDNRKELWIEILNHSFCTERLRVGLSNGLGKTEVARWNRVSVKPGTAPEHPRNTPEHPWNTPGTARNIPEQPRNTPGTSHNIPEHPQMPRNTLNTARNTLEHQK